MPRTHIVQAVTAVAVLALLLPSSARCAPPGQPHITPPFSGNTTTTGTTTMQSPASGGYAPGGSSTGRGGPGQGSGATVAGTITAIDTTAGTIAVTATSGTVSTLILTSRTLLAGHQTISAADIALGDKLDVAGVPLTFQTQKVTDVKISMPTAASTTSTGTSSSSIGTTITTPQMHIVGVVTVLSPPTITVDNTYPVVLETTSDTTFSEVVSLTAAQLAVGQTVQARVSQSSAGTLTANILDVFPAASA